MNHFLTPKKSQDTWPLRRTEASELEKNILQLKKWQKCMVSVKIQDLATHTLKQKKHYVQHIRIEKL